MKSRNFLSNISYTGINKNNFYNENFILDVYVLLVKNMNPFSLSRKISDKLKHEMVYMLWRECIPSDFYRYICEEKNFVYLNGRDVGTAWRARNCGKFHRSRKKNLRMLQESLARYKDIFQYVYSHVFSEIYTTSEKRGFDLKSNFHITFQAYQNKAAIRQQLAKTPSNYKHLAVDRKETFEFEQKPIKNFNEFGDAEEAELKKKAEIQYAEKRERAEEKRAEKRKLKLEENKIKEGEMWNRLNELNREFKKIKQTKKNEKKMSSTAVNKL